MVLNLNKKVKNLDSGEKINLEKIEGLNITDVFKLSSKTMKRKTCLY